MIPTCACTDAALAQMMILLKTTMHGLGMAQDVAAPITSSIRWKKRASVRSAVSRGVREEGRGNREERSTSTFVSASVLCVQQRPGKAGKRQANKQTLQTHLLIGCATAAVEVDVRGAAEPSACAAAAI